MSDLTGKTAVIIGASGTQSFGVASAKRLAAAGAKVVVSARRKEQLEALAAEIMVLRLAVTFLTKLR